MVIRLQDFRTGTRSDFILVGRNSTNDGQACFEEPIGRKRFAEAWHFMTIFGELSWQWISDMRRQKSKRNSTAGNGIKRKEYPGVHGTESVFCSLETINHGGTQF